MLRREMFIEEVHIRSIILQNFFDSVETPYSLNVHELESLYYFFDDSN